MCPDWACVKCGEEPILDGWHLQFTRSVQLGHEVKYDRAHRGDREMREQLCEAGHLQCDDVDEM